MSGGHVSQQRGVLRGQFGNPGMVVGGSEGLATRAKLLVVRSEEAPDEVRRAKASELTDIISLAEYEKVKAAEKPAAK